MRDRARGDDRRTLHGRRGHHRSAAELILLSSAAREVRSPRALSRAAPPAGAFAAGLLPAHRGDRAVALVCSRTGKPLGDDAGPLLLLLLLLWPLVGALQRVDEAFELLTREASLAAWRPVPGEVTRIGPAA